MFTDEKDFILNVAKNSQNIRVYGQNKREKYLINFTMRSVDPQNK